jgi:hypothetical protein
VGKDELHACQFQPPSRPYRLAPVCLSKDLEREGPYAETFGRLLLIQQAELLVVRGSRNIGNPASLWASIVLTIGPSILFEAFLVRKIIAQSVRVKRRSLGRLLRLVGADLYVLGKSPLS